MFAQTLPCPLPGWWESMCTGVKVGEKANYIDLTICGLWLKPRAGMWQSNALGVGCGSVKRELDELGQGQITDSSPVHHIGVGLQ